MAYREFSTKKADYVLQLGYHYRENKQVDIFKGIDALVIETGLSGLGSLLLYGHPQLDIAIKYCKNSSIPIFGTDVSCYAHVRAILTGALLPDVIFDETMFHYKSGDKKLNKLFSRLYSNYCFAVQDPLIEARNAVNARKIEEFVVGRVKEITGKKKPQIGLIFGAAHVGLEQNLRSKLRRNFTLWNYKNLNFKKYAGLDKKKLNEVYEGRFKGLGWQVKEHTVNLFKVK